MNLIKNHVEGAETNDSSLSNSGAVFTKILWKVSFMRFNKSFKEILEKINI